MYRSAIKVTENIYCKTTMKKAVQFDNNNNNNKHFKRPLTNVTKARATRIPWPIHICQSEQKRFQHLPKSSQCDCRITKRSGIERSRMLYKKVHWKFFLQFYFILNSLGRDNPYKTPAKLLDFYLFVICYFLQFYFH